MMFVCRAEEIERRVRDGTLLGAADESMKHETRFLSTK